MTRATLEEGARYLAREDPGLGAWIETIGPVPLRRQRSHFDALCRSILSQQLAKAAAATIYARFIALFHPERHPSPERVLQIRVSKLRRCGISGRKAEYLHEVARSFHSGHLRGARFARMSDADIIAELTKIPGVGTWTAEMFLIFALGRPDVYSPGDLVLRQGASLLAGKRDTLLSPKEAGKFAERWSPYRSVASLYLWKIVHWKGGSPNSE